MTRPFKVGVRQRRRAAQDVNARLSTAPTSVPLRRLLRP